MAPEHFLAVKPAAVTFAEAATVPISGYAALQALLTKGELIAGQQVLVIGAGGGVGLPAIQLAVALGAEVTAACRTRSVDLVRSVGAATVIDCSADDLGAASGPFDLILDCGGNPPLTVLRRLLTGTGTLVIVGAEGGGSIIGNTTRQIRAAVLNPIVRHRLLSLVSQENADDLEFLRQQLEASTLTPIVERSYPPEQTADAFRRLARGGLNGKLVVLP